MLAANITQNPAMTPTSTDWRTFTRPRVPVASASTYWSVGSDPPLAWRDAGGGARAAVDEGVDRRRSAPLVRRKRLRGPLAERHRRRRRDPPSEPAPPLPVEGCALRRGVRTRAERLV